ncbi:hypothetical protein P256_00031 [Acinetobacter nectaris CIP 110549]|uniref:Uncharacterized protein n=1 Tax=Acinetobacter nectaris CIP 110549 TaxID=1392540 RepID=V2TSX0_9GAMM|nr:hypothetical protein [Acinetobacter nectaris]ESK41046.1 hypothetical protein P256_00031 [Acinetobacter nectaris CIP 110549]
MNVMNSNFEHLYLPVFQEMEVDAEEIQVDGNKVYFSLVKPNTPDDFIALVIEAKDSSSFVAWNKTNDPQNETDVDFDSLVVDTHTPARVEQVVDCYAVEGMSIGLTDKQEKVINDFLESYFEERKVEELMEWAA